MEPLLSHPDSQEKNRCRSLLTRLFAVVSVLAIAAMTLVAGPVDSASANSNGYLFWTSEPGTSNEIGRAGIDGKSINKSFLTGADTPIGLSANKNHLFWGNHNISDYDFSIGRATVRGTGIDKTLLPSQGSTYSVAASDSKVYWTTAAPDGKPYVSRGNANGSGSPEHKFIEVPDYDPGPGKVVLANTLGGIAVNSKYVYWNQNVTYADESDPDGPEEGRGFIGRANLDGSGIVPNLVEGVRYSYSLATNNEFVYWVDVDTDIFEMSIGRASIDGSDINREVVPKASVLIGGLAIDSKYLYWTSAGDGPNRGSIGRSLLNGNQINREFITGLNLPFSLAVSYTESTPPVPDHVKKNQQFRKGAPPKKVKFRGTTVLNKARATTKQRRPLSAKVRVTFPRGELRCLKVRTLKNRKVTVRTYGRCTFTLRVTYTAPGNSQYKAFKKTKVYRVKR